MQSLNSAPYFDDYDESKDFHKILYKPGYPVQARELTQSQTILQSQISRFGDHVFTNGSPVTGGKISKNTQVYSVQIDTISITGISVGNYIVGGQSGLVAEIIYIVPATTSETPFLVYSVVANGSNGEKYINGETIRFYSAYDQTTQVAQPVKAKLGTTSQVSVSGTAGYNKLVVGSLTELNKVSIGAYIPSIDAYVISINTNDSDDNGIYPYTFRINKELTETVTDKQIGIQVNASTPTVLFGITEGVFYINKYFVRSAQQVIVPTPKNRWCSVVVGLTQVSEIVTSDDDVTLLDPAQGSYNYTAPGADRLKLSLIISAYERGGVSDPNFIELISVIDGEVQQQTTGSVYSEIMSTIARRTYDESGNYVVKPFIINLLDEGNPANISAVINPGKAYVGGYEFETITPLKVAVDRSLDTETIQNFIIDSYVGNYVLVSSVSGSIPASGAVVSIKENGVQKGTANFLQIASDSEGMKIYLSDISGTIAVGMTLSVNSFTATIASNVIDTLYKNRVFQLPQSHVKNISSINYKTKRVFKTVTFTNGSATITCTGNERFSGGTGVLAQATIKENYAILNTSKQFLSFGVEVTTASNGSSCIINVNDATYNGTADIIATIDINNESQRTKSLVQKIISIPSIGITNYTSIGYSDLYKIRYASVTPQGSTIRGLWVSASYNQNDIVYYENKIFSANSSITSTDSAPGISSKWSVLPDVSQTLLVNDGQRDMWYDHASIKSKTIPYTNLIVLFDYFVHYGNGLITVNSYPISYADIPSYTTSFGSKIELKDAIDSRPRRVDLSTSLVFDSVQFPDSSGVELTNEYYMPRIDKIVIDTSGTFKVLRGVSSYTQPLPPSDLSDAMTLATLLIPPYTSDVSNIVVIPVNNRRYTMRDIGVLDQRLGNVEYYTSINNLESSILNSNQYNQEGVEMFKSGFVADNFKTFNVGNVNAPEYRCSIDTTTGECHPRFKMGTLQLIEDSTISTTKRTGDLITLPYTTKSFIKNINPTGYLNINPFNVLRNIGLVKIVPSSDYWFSEATLPQVNILDENTSAFIIAQSIANAFNEQSQWNSWSTIWTGAQKSSSKSTTTVSGRTQTTTTTKTTLTDAIQSRSKSVQSVSSSTIVTGDDTKLVSREVQPFIRAKDISFVIDGVTPYTRLYGWVDDINVDEHITPTSSIYKDRILSVSIANQGSGYTSGKTTITIIGDGIGAVLTPVIVDGKIVSINIDEPGSGYTSPPMLVINGDGTGAVASASITVPSKGAELYSDINGHCEGILSFPEGKFTCGSHQVSFTDTDKSNRSDTCEALTLYTAEGYINNNQRTVISTRIPEIVTGTVSEQQKTTLTTVTKSSTSVTLPPSDPLAQTFFVEQSSGVFVHSVDVFFATKDESMPVIMELRPTVNGYPSNSIIIPFSVVTKYPSEIETSTNGSVPTTFTFESPVYLEAGEYAIVLKSGSNKFNVFISEMAKPIIGSTKVISEQPYIGSLFESQNASTWSADQFKDLCFEMRICQFKKETKSLVLKNSEVGANADLIHTIIQNLQPAGTEISAVAVLPSFSGQIAINSDINLPAQSNIANVGDVNITLNFTTNDVNISPVIDLERCGLICVENIINNNSETPETHYQLGSALSKYVTSRVTLNQGFNANSLIVYVNVSRPQESRIEVYFRAKNEFDTTDLSGHSWVKLNQEINGGNTSREGQFVEDKWSIYDYSYDTFADFNTFEVKVVMYSSNTCKVPVLGDVRAIALA